MSSKFSPFVIKALVDTITGGAANDARPSIGIYRSGPKIEQFFLDCGLDMRIGSSSRVPATTDFLRQAAQHYDGNGDTYITRSQTGNVPLDQRRNRVLRARAVAPSCDLPPI